MVPLPSIRERGQLVGAEGVTRSWLAPCSAPPSSQQAVCLNWPFAHAGRKFHEATTGPEILADFDGKKLDYWVTGDGTGGTFHGAGKVCMRRRMHRPAASMHAQAQRCMTGHVADTPQAIKAKRPDVKIVLAEPLDAGLLVSGIPTERNPDGSPAGSHPAFKPHPIQVGAEYSELSWPEVARWLIKQRARHLSSVQRTCAHAHMRTHTRLL